MAQQITWSVDQALVSLQDLAIDFDRLKIEIIRLKKTVQYIKPIYTIAYDFVSLVFDKDMLFLVKKVATEKRLLKPTVLLVIGIGGSSLGSRAAYQGLFGTEYNQLANGFRIYFAETVDSDYIYELVLLVEQELEKGNTVIINVISKSGTTLETITNFSLFASLLEAKKPQEYKHYIVITTDEGSLLWKIAQEKGFSVLPIPKVVGGRFSIFSSVGLFPLAMAGVDIDQLLQGGQDSVADCLNESIQDNVAACRALVLYYLYYKGFFIHDMFLFSIDLHNFGLWYRQLMGESIAKEHAISGEQLFIGITPTVSLGSTDLHSVAQLYLGGPYNKVTTFVSVKNSKTDVTLSDNSLTKQLRLSQLQSMKFAHIMKALFQGTKTAYKNSERPYMEFEITEKNPYCLGYLFQTCMIEMTYLGYLLGVNPFDQPEVEQYKKEAQSLL